MMVVGHKLPRQKSFFIKAFFSCLAACIVRYCLISGFLPAVTFPSNFASNVFISLTNLCAFIMCMIAVPLCYRTNGWGMVFCGTAGYCLQYVAYKVFSILSVAYFVQNKVQETILVLLIASIVIFAGWLYLRRVDYEGMMNRNWLQIMLALIVVFVTLFLDIQAVATLKSIGSGEMKLYYYIISLLAALVAFFMEYSILSGNNFQNKNDFLKQLLIQQREQYLSEKKSIDLVNIKCHDIRHHLREMADSISPEALEKITDAIDIYDSKIETGNEAISVVLAKYSLYCAKHDIRLTCMIDGAQLNYIPAYELYALFGNAIENAINAVKKLSREKRVISVTGQAVGNMMNICFTNFFSGELDYEDGLPTNRAENHGFGVKSIKMIAEEYGGTVNVQVYDDMFVMNIFFQLPISTE